MEIVNDKMKEMTEEIKEDVMDTIEDVAEDVVDDLDIDTMDDDDFEKDVELTNARKNLLEVIGNKVPSAARDIVMESLSDLINTLNKEDCDEMAEMIKEKGILALMRESKKKKKKLQKEKADMMNGRCN